MVTEHSIVWLSLMIFLKKILFLFLMIFNNFLYNILKDFFVYFLSYFL